MWQVTIVLRKGQDWQITNFLIVAIKITPPWNMFFLLQPSIVNNLSSLISSINKKGYWSVNKNSRKMTEIGAKNSSLVLCWKKKIDIFFDREKSCFLSEWVKTETRHPECNYWLCSSVYYLLIDESNPAPGLRSLFQPPELCTK